MLVLPRNAPSPTRVFIHWTDEAARRATLAVSASLLRHVSAEAVYLGIVPEGPAGTGRAAPMRALLDARSEAQHDHDLEMRTELAIGETVTELTRNLSAGAAQMLVLGITDITQAAQCLSQSAGRAAGLADADRLSAPEVGARATPDVAA